ncbi:hypothetical protein [Ancylobacter sp.]|uniref:hypothetical protein n=1 Tax=Ancylobacter sp. TaxID=1872567 RepID=UPI003C7B9DB1
MPRHPAFIGTTLAVGIVSVGLIFADGTVIAAARQNGAYRVLTDLGGFIGALVALAGGWLAYAGAIRASDNVLRASMIDRLRNYATAVEKLEYAYHFAKQKIRQPDDDVERRKAISEVDELRRCDDITLMRLDPIFSGEGRAFTFFTNTIIAAVAVSHPDRERDRDVIDAMVWEVKASISRRIKMLNEGYDIDRVSALNVISMNKYGKLIVDGTPIPWREVVTE